jgi:protease IV
MRRVLLFGGIVCWFCFVLIPVRGAEEKTQDAAKSTAASAKPADAKPADAKPAEKTAKADAEKAKHDEKKTKEAEKKPAEKKAAEKKATVVRFTLRGNYPEGPAPAGIFGEMQTSLATAVERMDQAAADKAVSAVWVRIEDLEIGHGKVQELRAAIARLRKAGKPVYAELTSADSAQYLLAGACDEIVMPPSGMLIIPGVRAEVTFYKGLLDKLGIQFDMLQMGKYKGAAEPMTRKAMSGPLRESFEALVDDNYELMASTIAADRKLKPYQVKTVLDEGLFTATAAQKARLIDHVAYADQFEDSLRKKLKVKELDIVTNYKKKQLDTDFSGISGMMKFMELLMGGKSSEKGGKQKKIAVVYAVGPIVEGKGANDFFGESSVGSNTLVANLKKAADDPKVVAIVLRIDSPGGSAVASDLIWRETMRIKKPIIASMGDVAGSGGYYIAMGARKIIAAPGTLTGSIGVIGGKVVLHGLYDKLGLTTEVISRGERSGSLSSTQPFSPDERKAWTALLEETYRQFVSKAAQGRKLSREELEKRAQGRVYTGNMAKGLGLVDQLGTLHDAIIDAKKAAGLKADEAVDLLILPRPQSVFEQLFGGDASLSSEFDSLAPDFMKVAGQAKLWQRLFAEPTLFWMPYGVKIK